MNDDSILTSTKKMLGIDSSDTAFDVDVIMHINGVFSTLSQLGIGPAVGFMIENDTTVWSAFLGEDMNLSLVKTYVYLKVRSMFDPPSTSFHLQAMQEQIKELEWRLNVKREGESWANPMPILPPEELELVW